MTERTAPVYELLQQKHNYNTRNEPITLKLFFLAQNLCERRSQRQQCSHTCALVNGNAKCFCPVGFELQPQENTQCVGKLQSGLVFIKNLVVQPIN